jgi:hypothetical protein
MREKKCREVRQEKQVYQLPSSFTDSRECERERERKKNEEKTYLRFYFRRHRSLRRPSRAGE